MTESDLECFSDVPSISQWSSLEDLVLAKMRVHHGGESVLRSGDICNKYVTVSDTSLKKHPLYNYPGVTDPGIREAIFAPERPLIYPDDGREIYLRLCSEMDICPVRMFVRKLLSDEINLSYYGVDPRGVRAMAIALQYNKFVKRFNLTDNFLNDDACYHLNQMLKSNVTLIELVLTGCRIGASGAKRLFADIYLNRSLDMLNLARNKISDEGGVCFAKQIDLGCTIKRLNLSSNDLGRDTAHAFGESLVFQNRIANLDLSRNSFYHIPTTVKMLQVLAVGQYLQELNLSWNTLGGERIGEAIKDILLAPNLMILDLSHNKLEGEAVSLISSHLMKAKKLVTLDLSFNPLTPADSYDVLQKMLRPRVKIVNLLMDDVLVNKNFPALVGKVKKLKFRSNFTITHGAVVENWTIQGPDPRELLLRRAYFLGNARKKQKVDIALFFLEFNKQYPTHIILKDFIKRLEDEGLPLDDDLVNEFANVFPGKKYARYTTVNVEAICEYIHRLWPEKKLPPTPPPEVEQEPAPPAPPIVNSITGKPKTKKKA